MENINTDLNSSEKESEKDIDFDLWDSWDEYMYLLLRPN